jgi:hypothetical protein
VKCNNTHEELEQTMNYSQYQSVKAEAGYGYHIECKAFPFL